ncbi:MAG TPA: Fic family protein [Candidatus Latescibacteria bacterium]|nr:Fic family protein [Candidatus Latescibacterota bacterium]
MERKTGHYETRAVGGESVHAFIPAPLPPDPPLDLTPARQRLLERATLALGRLDKAGELLPNANLLLYAYVRREAVLSSQIEGTQSSLSDLLLFELDAVPGLPVEDVVEVSNYVVALHHGVDRMRGGFPFCNRLIREMHRTLLSRGRGSDKLPGEFRRTQNWIGGTRPGNAHFVPPPPDHVERCMGSLERFMQKPDGSALVRAALAHVQFETIHPFLDGNGRVGRLLIPLLLHNHGALKQPLLYLSLFFKLHRSEYYRLLDKVRADGDWEAWLDFFLEGVEVTANGAIHAAQRLATLFDEDMARLDVLGQSAKAARSLLDALRERPVATLNVVRDMTGFSFPTVAKSMGALQRLGIVREQTGRRRNRVFVYQAYLAILNEGTEPL